MEKYKPTKQEIADAYNKSVPDIIAPNLIILFCGINPGLYTAAVQNHFGRPGNKFWKALYAAQLTPRLFHPSEQEKLLKLGIGITNLVNRATVKADEVAKDEFIRGGKELIIKVKRYKPQWVAFVGIQAYRTAFFQPHAKVGKQKNKIGNASVWILPSSSGLNAHYPPQKYNQTFRELKQELSRTSTHF